MSRRTCGLECSLKKMGNLKNSEFILFLAGNIQAMFSMKNLELCNESINLLSQKLCGINREDTKKRDCLNNA